MMRTVLVGLSLVLATIALAAQDRPRFQGTVDLVSIGVSVQAGNKAVQGLTARDFELTDNGVRQTVEMFEASSLPLDVTIALDTSGSMAEHMPAVTADLEVAKTLLRPDDRLRVITFSSEFHELADFQPVPEFRMPASLTGAGGTSMYDALSAALMPRQTADRRHLVIAFTDGIDTTSVLTSEALLDLSRRTDSVAYIFLVQQIPGDTPPPPPAFSSLQSLNTRRPWSPPAGDDGHRALQEVAENTGGRYEMTLAAKALAPSGLKQVLQEFRSGYVLRYRATGVTREGWHDVAVRVIRSRTFTVRARKGYFIGPPGLKTRGSVLSHPRV